MSAPETLFGQKRFAHVIIFLRNAGERISAILLARDALGISIRSAREWVDTVKLVRKQVSMESQRKLAVEYPSSGINPERLRDYTEDEVSHWPVSESVQSVVETPFPVELLSGVEALVKPDYHKLNLHAGRNDRLLHAVLCAYAKHDLGCEDIGWDRLGNILQSVICNEVGDDAYCRWLETMSDGSGIKPLNGH